jgi:hypothetical protein
LYKKSPGVNRGFFICAEQRLFFRVARAAAAFLFRGVGFFLIVGGRGGRRFRCVFGFVESVAAFAFAAACMFAHD